MRFIQYLGIFTCIVLLQGCVTVKLKSVLPEQAYYSLDNIKLEPSCKTMNTSLGLNISVLSPFDGKDILGYDEKSQIEILQHYKWIDLPKNMIRNNVIKAGLNHCIQIEQNPPISQKLKILQININELYVLQPKTKVQSKDSKENFYTGYIYLHYELMGYDLKRLKNGIIVATSQDSNPAKSLQNAVNEALQKVLMQVK
ncbi:hypothetical protein [Helicobacter sp. MIT 14-3879]|uniref:hypothetical protein n=1 Tax=Helicobacter sp. MIT 14-3879 TaxID=2040649 RepID=UPI0021611D87|nr:hypothetical protein [Helicobacter sp. MIT 14-3879]